MSEHHPALPGDLKRLNRQRVLRALRAGGDMSASDLHEATGISRPTVMRALQHYQYLGAVESVGLGSTTRAGGKKPELFRFANRQRILCLNLWPGRVTLALCGMMGGVYALEEHEQPPAPTLREALDALGELSEDYLARQGILVPYGVALTVPGTVDHEAQVLRYNSQAPGWGSDLALLPSLRERFGPRPVYSVENAGKAAGRAVLLDQPEYSRQRMLTLFTTWGVSACMMERGQVLSGRDSLIGEIGHMLISDHGPVVCGCGKRGCLESLVSLARVRARMEERGARPPADMGELFERSRAGEAAARETSEALAHCFAVALHNLSLAYNQEAVIFQGDYAWADEAFDRRLKEELREFRYYPSGRLFTIAYDRRPLALLASMGAAEELRARYFDSLQ